MNDAKTCLRPGWLAAFAAAAATDGTHGRRAVTSQSSLALAAALVPRAKRRCRR